MSNAARDENFVPTLTVVDMTDGKTPMKVYGDPTTHRLLVDLPGGGAGTVTSVSVVSANGLAGTVANPTTTAAITLTTSITGILKGNGTAISAATDGSDYLSSTTGVTIAQGVAQTIGTTSNRVLKLWATDITVTNAIAGSITGNAATVTTNANLTGPITSTGNATAIAAQTGTGTTFVMQSTPTLTTPVLGVATITSLNKVAITAPATAATLAFGTDNATITFQGTDTYVGRTTTDTLINKRITKRTGTATSSATPTINTDAVDYYSLTAQAVDITSFTTNLSGTPTENQRLWVSITGTATRAIAWGASFEDGAVALPLTTVGTTRLDVGLVWNTTTTKWRCMAQG